MAGIGLAVLVGVGDIDIDLRADVGRSSDGGRPMPIPNRDFGLWSGGKGRYGGEGMGLEGEMHGYVSEGVCGLGEVLTVENDVDRRVGLGSAVACEVEGEEGGYSWGEGGDREVPGTDLEGRVRGGVEEVGDDDVLEPGLLAGYDGVRFPLQGLITTLHRGKAEYHPLLPGPLLHILVSYREHVAGPSSTSTESPSTSYLTRSPHYRHTPLVHQVPPLLLPPKDKVPARRRRTLTLNAVR